MTNVKKEIRREIRLPLASTGNGDGKRAAKGATFLHIAAGIDDEDEAHSTVSDLLAHGAHPNEQDGEGRTSLHIAAAMGHLKVVDLLMLNGGDPLLSDRSGYSPLDHAFSSKQMNTLKYLSYLLDEEDYEAYKQKRENFRLEFLGEEVVQVPVIITSPPKLQSSLPAPFMTTFSDTDETDNGKNIFTADETSVEDCLGNYKIFMKTRSVSSADSRIEADTVSEQLQNAFIKEMTVPTDVPFSVESGDDEMVTIHSKTGTSLLDQAIILSSSEMESWVTAASTVESRAEEYLYTDEEKDIVLLERRCQPLSSLAREVEESFKQCVKSSMKSTVRSLDNELIEKAKFEDTQDSIGSPSESVNLLDSRQLREELKALGGTPGPITSTTMNVYRRQLMHLRKYPVKQNVSTETKPEETQDSIGSPSESVNLLDSRQLREELKALGGTPGPITSTTMNVYRRQLMRLRKYPVKQSVSTETKPVKANYPRELQKTLQDIKYLDLDQMGNLEEEMKEPFVQPDKSRHWRGGTCKYCFNYLLLDPRMTQNFPLMASMMSEEEKFELFISSVFYIGKGSQGRPYCHLYEAIQTKKQVNSKIEKIQEIWENGLGVVSLHVFHNTIPVEAWTREAAMISAIGLDNLANCVQGTFYGPASTWRNGARRLLGIYLLHKAMNILMLEGETQIRPADVWKPKWMN